MSSVRVLVDTGSSYLTVTDEITRALGFDPQECRVRVVILADGRRVRVPVIGPLQIQFEDRECTVDAYVMGGAPLPRTVSRSTGGIWIRVPTPVRDGDVTRVDTCCEARSSCLASTTFPRLRAMSPRRCNITGRGFASAALVNSGVRTIRCP
jgi:hypothetical protein